MVSRRPCFQEHKNRFEIKEHDRIKALKQSVFESIGANGHKVQAEIVSQQVRQISRASLSI